MSNMYSMYKSCYFFNEAFVPLNFGCYFNVIVYSNLMFIIFYWIIGPILFSTFDEES